MRFVPLPRAYATGIFSAFNSGNPREERVKAQNVQGGSLSVTAVVKGLSLFVQCRCSVLRLSNQYSFQFINNMGAYLGKGTYWQFFHKLDSRENSLLNAANHFKIFLIGFGICLYEHLYFLYIRNPLFLIVAFISMFWQLKVNMFYQKNSFSIV